MYDYIGGSPMFKKEKQNSKRKKVVIISTLLIAVSAILYSLAYRYLIDRVEATVTENADPIAAAVSTSPVVSKPNEIKADDWSYNSDNIDIKIEKVTKGSGSDKITYFVADIKLKDSSYLRSAFANNSFGRNIVENTSTIAEENQAIFAINGDYYGFRSDGVIIRNSTLYRDEPVRNAAAFYSDGTMKTIEETKVSSKDLLESGVIDTFSFGPVLVKDGKVANNLNTVVVDTNFGNKSIQGPNPRTGIGTIDPNHLVFIVVDGRMENYSRGMTLNEFAQVFEKLGCVEAYNLDGGGSSTMYFMGRVVNNPLGKGKERAVSDILYIKE
jgi:exopolysaccharide biosynthesis protein